ncbi:type II toxin-antitoxin system CcdA family antitoxin [Sphingosinicella sp. LHD-64]|uniref:type II toxin-antitoxin system CcdA family antitoxin n=1 Tax=Sphingosinicella sp. LHD-64 TaxID=3072139 RepID=UPI00280E0FC9|nr:type II toxin-antitoxin system CcdA family antitoxin [Sphingosinicella sp. LHD-64]MDQ8755045.1 type II toxin-antitoxin system CcdA family antitoxin [Sphingosinicella sp. LHD-64]
MNAPGKVSSTKRATNVSLRSDLIDEAKKLGINISEACEQGLEKEVARSRREVWLEQNREAIEAANAWVEKHGLPLARYRQF